MHRTESSRAERCLPVPASRPAAIDVLLRTGRRESGESVTDARHRRAVFEDTVLRQSPYGHGFGRQPQADSASDAADGHRSDLQQATDHTSSIEPQNIPVFTAKYDDYAARPGLEHRHHIRSHVSRFSLPGCGHGLVQPLRAIMATVEHARRRILPGGAGGSPRPRPSGNFQQRSGQPVHGRVVHLAAGELRHIDQYGRPRPGNRQRVYRAAVANSEIRGGVPEGLFHGMGGGSFAGKLLSVLLPRANTPIARLPHAGGGLSNALAVVEHRRRKNNKKSRAKWGELKHYLKRKQASASARDLGGVSRAAKLISYTLNNPFGCPNNGVHRTILSTSSQSALALMKVIICEKLGSACSLGNIVGHFGV